MQLLKEQSLHPPLLSWGGWGPTWSDYDYHRNQCQDYSKYIILFQNFLILIRLNLKKTRENRGFFIYCFYSELEFNSGFCQNFFNFCIKTISFSLEQHWSYSEHPWRNFVEKTLSFNTAASTVATSALICSITAVSFPFSRKFRNKFYRSLQ